MKYIFGPISSRRLGLSLGVDIVPYKHCSFDCVYCEAGKTTCLATKRSELVPTEEVIAEMDEYLSSYPKLDFVTFSGNGEPALSTSLEKITDFMKQKFPQYKLCLITNSSSYLEPRVDVLVPSLDAVSQEIFEKVNRPAKGVLAEDIVRKLADFQKAFSGEMWLEIFFVSGVNDTCDELDKLVEAVQKIKPNRVQLNTLDRPGSETWVQPVAYEKLQEVAELDWGVPVDIPTRSKKVEIEKNLDKNLLQQIGEIVKRRPCTVVELSQILGMNLHVVSKEVAKLVAEGSLKHSTVGGLTFIKAN